MKKKSIIYFSTMIALGLILLLGDKLLKSKGHYSKWIDAGVGVVVCRWWSV